MTMALAGREHTGVGRGSGWLTVQEAAGYMGYSVNYVRVLVWKNRIDGRQPRPGARVLISRESCDRYLKIQSN